MSNIEWVGNWGGGCAKTDWRGLHAECWQYGRTLAIDVDYDDGSDDLPFVEWEPMWAFRVVVAGTGEVVLNSYLYGGHITSDDLCRVLCEAVMRAHALEVGT